jgi:predicted nucleic acid-binding protein
VIAVDSSVVIAACATWHESHPAALGAFERNPSLIGHCALEAYSVLTRLPGAQRVPSALVVEFLRRRFPQEPLTLSAAEVHDLVPDLHERGIVGGAVYDAIVAMSARVHGAELVSLDRRAAETYRRCEVAYRLL